MQSDRDGIKTVKDELKLETGKAGTVPFIYILLSLHQGYIFKKTRALDWGIAAGEQKWRINMQDKKMQKGRSIVASKYGGLKKLATIAIGCVLRTAGSSY